MSILNTHGAQEWGPMPHTTAVYSPLVSCHLSVRIKAFSGKFTALAFASN